MPDLFEKCRGFFSDPSVAESMGYPASPNRAKELGVYPFFIPLVDYRLPLLFRHILKLPPLIMSYAAFGEKFFPG